MTLPEKVDVAVVGGGIVGLATAYALTKKKRPPALALLEAETRLAPHQTGHNSGVIHSGLYYKPGSAKATYCREGRLSLVRFCEEQGVPFRLCGKLVVATRPEERPLLALLEERAAQNGLAGVRRLSLEEMREREPHVSGLEALVVPEAGVVDFVGVAEALGRRVREAGGAIVTGARLRKVVPRDGALVLETEAGSLTARVLVACAGLDADRVARLAGIEPAVLVVPFRGDYFQLAPERRDLVKALIYPVPDPRFPFLGVHFTRRVSDVVEVGPSAVLAGKRTGYSRFSFSPRDVLETALFPGFWRFLSGHLAPAAAELHRAFHPAAFARAAQALVPEVKASDLLPAGCGVRAQAMARDGKLVDDFVIHESPRMVHVLNAPSPAATASLRIGAQIAELVRAHLD